MPRDGLLVDFGGVLTTNVFDAFAEFCRAEGLAPDTVRDRFMGDPRARGLLGELETGQIDEAGFEPRFAALLGLDEAEGLVDRLFAGMVPEPAMLDAVRAARGAGVRTGLVSNSWGLHRYDHGSLGELFDTLVISGEVGIRKPSPEIYSLAAERLGRAPERIVFVDDLPGNLKPARAIGMATVLHRDAATTVAELEQLLGVSLR